MKRREFMVKTAALSAAAAIPTFGLSNGMSAVGMTDQSTGARVDNPLTPPKTGRIPVAFVLSEGAVVIDFAGPWEVFEVTHVPSRPQNEDMPFSLYTVAETLEPIKASSGLKIMPDYTFANAPAPKVIVIPAQRGRSKAMLDWIREASSHTDVTMSVCTGAFVLAKTGLLSGKAATTHHGSYRALATDFPDIQVKRGARFVEAGNLATAGGLSSGIDLALRVVERYFGRNVALDTAYELEYQGQGWMDAASNSVYLEARRSTDERPLCPVCGMEVDPKTAPKSLYKEKTYYFCSTAHKTEFDAAPQDYTQQGFM